MDNICHTLTGAALGEAGLKRLTPYANAALMTAANLPDVDALVFLTGTSSVAFRRGWTHGPIALALLPVAMTAAFVAVDRVRARRAGREPTVRPAALLALGYIGVLSHVFLDYLNIYGVRLLMPFDRQWFYGDAVFIVDPWLWLLFGAGVMLARRALTPAPARAALAMAAAYIAGMIWTGAASRQIVLDAWTATYGAPPRALMVGPAPINPFRKEIIVDAGDRYVTGTFGWWPRDVRFDAEPVLKNEHLAALPGVRENPAVRATLVWARFPHYLVSEAGDGARVTLQDVRYGTRVGSTTVVVTR